MEEFGQLKSIKEVGPEDGIIFEIKEAKLKLEALQADLERANEHPIDKEKAESLTAEIDGEKEKIKRLADKKAELIRDNMQRKEGIGHA